MRTMVRQDGSFKYNIVEHIITKNFWEYYITDEPCEHPDIKLCYVMGFEDELGDVYMPEIKPYIISRTTDLKEVMPARGFIWADEEGDSN